MNKTIQTAGVLFFVAASFCLAKSVSVGAAADAHIIKSLPTKNFGTSPYMSSRTAEEATDIRRALIRFDLSEYAGMTVARNATLTLSVWGASGQTKGDKIVACLVDSKKAGWDEKEVTWDTFDNAYSPECISSAVIPSSSGGFRPLTIPADIIQAWIDNPESNAGLLIRLEDETSEDDAVHWNTKETTKGNRFVPVLKCRLEE